MRISDWSSDVCSSDLPPNDTLLSGAGQAGARASALAGLEARVGLVDDVDPALATDHAAIPMAGLDRKSVVEGKRVSVRVDLGGRRTMNNKKHMRDDVVEILVTH